MTAAEPYPMLTIPSHQLYEIAHLATFIAGALARRRHALARGEHNPRTATRDVHLGHQAMAAATSDPAAATSALPHPIDAATYRLAEQLHEASTDRRADVVSLASLGRDSWAVTGYVPGVGMVGAEVANRQQAAAIKEHLLTQPADHLADWAVTSQPMLLGGAATRDRESLLVEASQAVRDLDPANPQHIALAKHLRDPGSLNAAVRDRFAGVDLDGPVPRAQPGDPQPTKATMEPKEQGSASSANISAAQRHEAAVQRAAATNAAATPAAAAAARAQVALTPTAAAAAKAGVKRQRAQPAPQPAPTSAPAADTTRGPASSAGRIQPPRP